MKKFLNKSFFINLILIIIFIVIIIISSLLIKIDSSLNSLLPDDKQFKLSVDLTKKSTISDKVIIYIEVDDQDKLEVAVNNIDQVINQSLLKFKNAVPSTDDILKLYDYIQKNSLLLYPYESENNPFTESSIIEGLNNKYNYLSSVPFINLDESFFSDPLMFASKLMSQFANLSNGVYSPRYGGIVSDDKKSYIKILKASFYTEDYEKVKLLKELDLDVIQEAKDNQFNAFLFCSHFYFLDSKTKIKKDIALIFIFTTILVLIIFYFFFKKISLIIYSIMPLLGGFAVTFFIISIIKPKFGGIAFAFGATTIGISFDYIIHYLTKRNFYSNLSEVRKKINLSLLLGFITTLFAFIFLMFSKIESLKEISFFGIVSVSCVFLISYFLLQPLIPPQKITNIKVLKIPFINNKYIFYLWLLTFIALILFIPLIKFEDNVMNLDMNHKELDNRKNIIMSKFKESNDNIFLAFTDVNRDKILAKSLKANQLVQNESKELNFITPALLSPPDKIIEYRKEFIKNNFDKDIFIKHLKNSNFTPDAFNIWIDKIDNIDNLMMSEISNFFKNQFDSMFVKFKEKEYLLIHIYKREISNEIKDILLKNNIDFNIIDIIEDSKKGLIVFEQKALLLLSLSLLLIYIIVSLALKNFIYGFTSILPGITGLLTCIFVSYFTNNGFNLMHFVSSVLLIGIGVDYGIFITAGVKNNFNKTEMDLTFQSILICALTTISGFGVLILSSNFSVFSIGSSMFTGILSALLTSFYGLPFILNKLTKYNFNNNKENNN